MAGYNSLHGDVLPPARFDHPYPGQMIVMWADDHTVDVLCHGHAGSVAGCMVLRKAGKCHILIRERYRGTAAGAWLVRHERGHCNGWGRFHEL